MPWGLKLQRGIRSKILQIQRLGAHKGGVYGCRALPTSTMRVLNNMDYVVGMNVVLLDHFILLCYRYIEKVGTLLENGVDQSNIFFGNETL